MEHRAVAEALAVLREAADSAEHPEAAEEPPEVPVRAAAVRAVFPDDEEHGRISSVFFDFEVVFCKKRFLSLLKYAIMISSWKSIHSDLIYDSLLKQRGG